MLKNHDLMYCFELDGTLVNNIPYSKSVFKRNLKILRSECIFNPSIYDIRWTIITNHPLIDYPTIRLFCFMNSMVPSQIITSNIVNMYNNVEACAEYKINIFKKILDNEIKVNYTKSKVKKIINICNDQNENKLINLNRNRYDFISVNIIDFKHLCSIL